MPEPHPGETHNPTSPRRVAVVTTGRADYGILTPVLAALEARPDTAPRVYATGAHLPGHNSGSHPRPLERIKADGWLVAAEITSEPARGDLPTAAKLARAVAGFADAFGSDRPDVCVLLGDRFETLAAATAAAATDTPIAHLHGGEITLGALDNQFRYAITALANLHCVATEFSRARLIAMGEPEHTVIRTGAPGLDAIAGFDPMPRDAFCREAGLPTDDPFLLVTLHPETIRAGHDTGGLDAADQATQLQMALAELGMPCLVTAANQDAGSRQINDLLRLMGAHTGWPFADALGTRLYHNAMHHAAAMVGNSSSGIIEAASFNLPVVNIGDRQAGRERSGNVIDCPHDAGAIRAAIDAALALRSEHEQTGRAFTNIYGDGRAAPRIAEAIAAMPLGPAALRKPFEPPGL